MKVVKRIPSPLCGEYVVYVKDDKKGKRYYWQWFAPAYDRGAAVFGSDRVFRSTEDAINDIAKELAWHIFSLEDEE